jgi:hypothetical protein
MAGQGGPIYRAALLRLCVFLLTLIGPELIWELFGAMLVQHQCGHCGLAVRANERCATRAIHGGLQQHSILSVYSLSFPRI